MSGNANNSLRPAWNRGNSKGFQPPPAVASERSRSQSIGAEEKNTYNTFSALNDDDEDFAAAAAAKPGTTTASAESRSQALRGTGIEGRSSSVGSGGGGGGKSGRSLADLAARAPEQPRRFAQGPPTTAARESSGASSAASETKEAAVKTIRFTRERLLSMRPNPRDVPTDLLREELEGTVILAETPQDPVCWDTFEAEEIWATAVPRRTSSMSIKAGAPEELGVPRRPSSMRERSASGTGGGGRWQRGVALPPEGQQQKPKAKDAEDPSELWDDPGSHEAAAADFSAFGAMPSDDDEVFDFEKMTQASKKLEEEMHGRSRASSQATADETEELDENGKRHETKIDPKRPLATVGTTIRSGSGDGVNVFEDFDDPATLAAAAAAAAEAAKTEVAPPIKAVTEDPNASSRLMAMIGVKKDETAETDPQLSAWGDEPKDRSSSVAGLSLNPWGDPILTAGSSNSAEQLELERQARIREAEQKAAAERRRREQQEEAQRRQQEQERVRAAQQQEQRQQQNGVQSQVELVLMERISTILENSWGRSDLHSILSTLHAEDSRVIPLLNNVDALRALLLRNPSRVAIRQDPALRAEMAALLVTNAQWQQQQQAQQQHQAMHQREEQQRREQQRQLEERQAAAARVQQIVPEAPWYYSDPSRNIQGPFRGEEMRQWLEAGYFKGDLPISQNPGGPFRPLSQIFTDLSVAFANPAADAEAEALAAAEKQQAEEQARREQAEQAAREEAEAAAKRERLLREQQELERQRAEERRAREEQEKAEAAAKKANGGNGNESSAQLKLMLGLGAQVADESSGLGQPIVEGKGAKKSVQQHAAPKEPATAAAAKNAAPAWGGAARSVPVSKKSMSEIQKEEARAAAVAAMNNQGGRPSSSGWANVASARGGSTAWPGGAAKQTPAAVIASADTRTGVQRSMSLQPKSLAATRGQAAPKGPGGVQRSQSVSGDAAADAFGAKMSPALEKWCKEQMHKLNGTDDLTLIGFCMTLNDPDEIRQYLTAYLGATPQVNSFATEFINRKGGGKDKKDEWESTATVKKGRKKKAGAR